MEKQQEEMVKVGGFEVPKSEADKFLQEAEETAKAAMEMMKVYCPVVERKTVDPMEGEAVISYFKNGEEAFKVLLDPFEVPIMKMAMGRGTLEEYILAKNGLTKEEALYISKLEPEA